MAPLVFAGLAAAPAAHAAWETVPDIGLRAESDDNVRMQSGDTETSSRSVLDARFRLTNFGERGNAYIEPRIVTDAYGNAADKELANDDAFLNARVRYNWQTFGIAFNWGYSEESVLRSEFDPALPDDPDFEDPDAAPPIDTGAGVFNIVTSERQRLNMRLNLNFRVSERTTLSIESRRIDVSYIDDLASGRTPFDDREAAARITRRVDERNSVSARVFVSEYSADRNSNSTDSIGVEGSFTRPLSETWQLDLTAGVMRSDYAFVENLNQVANADANFSAGITLTRRSERTDWDVGFGRYINPNSNGFLSVRNEFRAGVRHDFSERFSASFGLRGSKFDPIGDQAGVRDRQYVRASLQFEWLMTRRWFIATGLDHLQEDRSSAGVADATSTMLFVGITYRGLSRQ